MKKLVFTFLVLLFGANAFAQSWADSTDVILPTAPELYFPMDRPSQTFNAKTAAKNSWIYQMGIEWGGLVTSGYSQNYNVIAFPINLRYGITDKLEAMLSPSPTFASVNGGGGGIEYSLGSFGAALRYSLFKNKGLGSMAVLGGYQMYNYERGIKTGTTVELKVLYAVPLGRLLTFATNLGYQSSDFTDDAFTYTANFSVPFTQKFGFYVEAYGSVPTTDNYGSKNSAWYDLGLYWLAQNNFQLDAGYAQGGSEEYRDFYSFVGFCYLFGQGK